MSSIYAGNFLNKTQHSPTEEAVLDALNTFGCVAVSQLDKLCPPMDTITKDSRGNYIARVCMHLSRSKQANLLDEKYLVQPGVNSYDENILLSLWVYMDLLKDRDDIFNIYRNCPKAKYPCVASFIKDNEVLYNVIPIANSGDASKILVENDNYKAYSDIGLKREYVLVFRSMEDVNLLKKMKPEFPFRVAVAEGNLDSPMKVSYYEVD